MQIKVHNNNVHNYTIEYGLWLWIMSLMFILFTFINLKFKFILI